jgi:hypothetical protein
LIVAETLIRDVVFEDEAGGRYHGSEYEVVIHSREIRRDRMRQQPQRTKVIRLEGEPPALGRSVKKRPDGTYLLVNLNKVVREVEE